MYSIGLCIWFPHAGLESPPLKHDISIVGRAFIPWFVLVLWYVLRYFFRTSYDNMCSYHTHSTVNFYIINGKNTNNYKDSWCLPSHLVRSITTMKSDWSAGHVGWVVHRRKHDNWRPHLRRGVRRNTEEGWEEIEKKLRRNRDEKEVNLLPTDGNRERVEGDGRRGNFSEPVPLHHTQHKSKQFVLNYKVVLRFFVFYHLQQIEWFLLL